MFPPKKQCAGARLSLRPLSLLTNNPRRTPRRIRTDRRSFVHSRLPKRALLTLPSTHIGLRVVQEPI